jgi:cytochrome c oxidase assembly factor 1
MDMRISSATCNSSVIRFSGLIQKAFPRKIKYGKDNFRKNLSICTISPASSSTTTSLVVRSPRCTAFASPADVPQRSDEWFALRKDKLTTSTFSTALGFWKGARRSELWHEKVFASESQIIQAAQRNAMAWGMLNESVAVEKYTKITGREVTTMGFAVHSKQSYDWLGASPDGVIGTGILEVKCPYNKGKPETGLPWSTMPFYYMPQVQGQMEVMDFEWVDLYCWTPNGSTIFRVIRDRGYWDIIHGVLREFWWENVVPAREALLLGCEEDVESYKPASTHKLTGLAIAKSIKLASESKLLCREIAGHVEFFT